MQGSHEAIHDGGMKTQHSVVVFLCAVCYAGCMTTCLLGLGSNLGDRVELLQRAIACLDQHEQCRVESQSQWFETAPVGGPADQMPFVNAAIRLTTELEPRALLELMHQTEAQLGRERRVRWAARAIDIDLLLFGETVVNDGPIEVPHPRMAFRRFVLEPAAEVGGDMLHPIFRLTVADLLERLNRRMNYVALAGSGTGLSEGFVRAVADASAADGQVQLIGDSHDDVDVSKTFERRAALLDRFSETAAKRAAISDFWLGESLLLARRHLGPDEAARFESVALPHLRSTVCPKLLVMLYDDRSTRAERAEIRQLAIATETCPFLELDTSNRDWVVTEIRAALEASQ